MYSYKIPEIECFWYIYGIVRYKIKNYSFDMYFLFLLGKKLGFFFFFALLYWPTSKEFFYLCDSIDISVPSFHLTLFAIISH